MEVVLVGRDDHARYIAKGYQEKGVLKKYYCFYYSKENFISKIVEKIFYKNIKLRNRVDINEKLVKNFLMHRVITLIIAKILFFHKDNDFIASAIADALYDLYVCITLPRADVYHVWSQYSLFTMKKIKKKYPKSKIILEVYCAYPEYREAIYAQNELMENRNTPEKYMINRIKKEILLSNYINVSSYHVKESICKYIENQASKIKIIPYGSDKNNFYPIETEKSNNNFKILYVGRGEVTKGVNYLIDAVDILVEKKRYQFELIMIGKESKDIRDYIDNKPRKYLTRMGGIPNGKLIKYYNQADIFVLPSPSESMGMVLSEAMLCGLPVITTQNANWIIENNKNGYVVDINSVEQIVDAIIHAYENPKERIQIGLAGRIDAEKNDWSTYFEKFYKEFFYE